MAEIIPLVTATYYQGKFSVFVWAEGTGSTVRVYGCRCIYVFVTINAWSFIGGGGDGRLKTKPQQPWLHYLFTVSSLFEQPIVMGAPRFIDNHLWLFSLLFMATTVSESQWNINSMWNHFTNHIKRYRYIHILPKWFHQSISNQL